MRPGASRQRHADRKSAAVLLLVGLMVAAPCGTRAGDQEDPRSIVASAVRAAGGRSALARYPARVWKEKAVYHGTDGDERYEASYVAAWPDKIRVVIGDFTLAVNGDKGWVRTRDATRDMTREELEEHAEGAYSVWVLSLLPLESDEFSLSPLRDASFAGAPTTGINVSHRGHFDIQLYFDRKTSLLAMSRTRYKEARSGKEVAQETFFSGYESESGIKTPTTISIRRDGKLAVEASVETRYLTERDERVFAKP